MVSGNSSTIKPKYKNKLIWTLFGHSFQYKEAENNVEGQKLEKKRIRTTNPQNTTTKFFLGSVLNTFYI